MKISKLFHWLYASLMLLPFASVVSTTLYYSFNKNAVIPQVDKEVSKEVDFNQLVKDGQNISSSNWVNVNNSIEQSTDYIYVASGRGYSYQFINDGFNVGDKILYKISYLSNVTDNYNAYIQNNVGRFFYTSYGSTQYFEDIFVVPDSTTRILIEIGILNSDNNYYYCSNVMYFNLTKMFGAGNEPTIQEFNAWFPNDYYDYTLSERVVIPNYETIQVADNSINHFWLPSFGSIGYNIQSYIGWLIGDVFGLNVVNGIGFVIVRLFTYWLIISICWLIFDLLMYVPNLVHKWLDKAAID